MEELGILPGGNSSQALNINDSGTVVGGSSSASGDRAFVWKKQTGIVDLNNAGSSALGIVLMEAHAINRKGEILAMGELDARSDGGRGSPLRSGPAIKLSAYT